MKVFVVLFVALLSCLRLNAQHHLSIFEQSDGKRSATFQECIQFYKELTARHHAFQIDTLGITDAGFPLYIISINPSATSKAAITVMIINGIHPGEPDGIDASMMLMRDISEGRCQLPTNLRLVLIPIYNIGGALNRNSNSRVNQVGPEAYGFRGNSRNLDLNRDFTKCDSREAALFSRVFQKYRPDIFIDTHVSDGADYQHTMTLLSSQYDKLGGSLGQYFRDRLDPLLYQGMALSGWPMVPYVNAEETPEKGWTAFYDPPRFSSGYASLFHTIAWVPETHMLKPFDQRVKATQTLLEHMLQLSGIEADTILRLRQQDLDAQLQQLVYPLGWKDSSASLWAFKGYQAEYIPSLVTGQTRLHYNRNKPIDTVVPIRDHYMPQHLVSAPKAYLIPQAWKEVIERLRNNQVPMEVLAQEDWRDVMAYTIDSFKTNPTAYEGHYKHSAIHATVHPVKVHCFKGDVIVRMDQPYYRRFILEMLEPAGEDSYFAWNFFDAILQRKEGYSDYRWEDVAAQELIDHPDLRRNLEDQKNQDPKFARDAAAQLLYVYRHSKWMEPTFMRYPVYRIE